MKKLKIFNNLVIITMIIIDIYAIFMEINNGTTDKLLGKLSLFLILLVPWLLDKLLKIKLSITLQLIFNIFIFFAFILGVIVDLYNITNWYDKVIHGTSGVLTSILSVLLLIKFTNKRSKFFDFIFILSFSMLIASLWEFFEFSVDQIMGLDLQHIVNTGIKDTMSDMIVAFIGSIIFSIYFIFLNKKNTFERLIGE